MIFVKIGSEERRFETPDEQWINQQIHRRREDGVSVCVQVRVVQGDLSMTLATAGCPRSYGSGTWIPDEQEQRILDLWNKFGLHNQNFSGGELVAFLKHLRNAL